MFCSLAGILEGMVLFYVFYGITLNTGKGRWKNNLFYRLFLASWTLKINSFFLSTCYVVFCLQGFGEGVVVWVFNVVEFIDIV
jgi:hypothetical protein